MTLDYAAYSNLADTTWTSTNGGAYGNIITLPFSEIIIFGAVTLYTGYKLIACEYRIKKSNMVGYLYVSETLVTKFIFGNAEKQNSSFDLTDGKLTIYSKDPDVYMSYV
jgi:hypothetical protein